MANKCASFYQTGDSEYIIFEWGGFLFQRKSTFYLQLFFKNTLIHNRKESYVSDKEETSCTCNKCPKCSLLPVHQAWETQGWDNPGTLDRLMRYTDPVCDLWTSTGASNTLHKLASETWESTAKRQPEHHLCTINKWFWIWHFLEDNFPDFKTKSTRILAGVQKMTLQTLKVLAEKWLKDKGLQAVKHPMYTNWLQLLLEWPSARLLSATEIPKLAWPSGHCSLDQTHVLWSARAAQLSPPEPAEPKPAQPNLQHLQMF